MFIYILQCKDGSFYTGKTKNIKNRITRHSRASKYTKARGIDGLVYVEEIADNLAAKREVEIKKYSRTLKEKLINSQNNLANCFDFLRPGSSAG